MQTEWNKFWIPLGHDSSNIDDTKSEHLQELRTIGIKSNKY